ncbi:MAG: helix-hairpin-helix domain-containing protein [Thermodesulfobacterium sp.]|nr:helix-hairpin-helix domain-containing protein [Thermodesulfobacterium sp.]
MCKSLKILFLIFLFLTFLSSFSCAQNRIDLNKATAEELESLPGIGPKIAKNIIEYREKFGPFKSVEELLEVKGIGPKKLKRLKKYLKVEEDALILEIPKDDVLEIYYYKDEKGIIHYTHFPETVPEKYKSSLKRMK